MNLLDFIFPKSCLECGKHGKYICETCLKKVHKYGWQGNTYSVFRYEGVIKKAIIALKYKYSTEMVKELNGYMVNELKKQKFIGKYCLVPIPLHKNRLNERGFNQSEEVGKLIAEKLNWDFNANLLIKNKDTKHQVGLHGGERRQNLHNAFTVNPNCVLSTKYCVLLFDDVATTGSTLREAENTLLLAGYKNIYGLTIAR